MACTRRREVELQKKYTKQKKTATDPVDIIRAHCLSSGITGIRAITRAFKKADKDGSGTLSLREFQTVVTRVGVSLDERLLKKAFDSIDTNKDGLISLQEATTALRPTIPLHRLELIHRVFIKLDRDRSGHVTLEDLHGVYDAKKHPKYLNGEWSEAQVTQEFIKTFDASKDGKISEDEFRDYYCALSASIDNNAYFDLIMRQAWGL